MHKIERFALWTAILALAVATLVHRHGPTDGLEVGQEVVLYFHAGEEKIVPHGAAHLKVTAIDKENVKGKGRLARAGETYRWGNEAEITIPREKIYAWSPASR